MSDPSLTHSAAGTSAVATTTATFGFTATANRLLVLIVGADDYKTGDPTGYTLPTGGAQQTFLGHYLFYKIADGTETSVDYTIGSATKSAWIVLEYDRINWSDPFDVSDGQLTATSAGTYTTPSVTPSTGRRFAIGSLAGSLDHDFIGLDSWTNSYTEDGEQFHSGSGTRDIIGAASLALDGNGSATTSTGATYSASGGFDPQARTAIIAVFKVIDRPTIDTQPQSVTVYSGQTATFTISATTSGGTLHYQWKDDGSNVGTDSSTYAPTAALSDSGSLITCVVSDDNGNATSANAILTVLPSAQLAWIRA